MLASTEPRTEVRGELMDAIREHIAGRASTEPRTEVRGEVLTSNGAGSVAWGFNGATHRSAWRVVATEPMARAGYLASTEPRTEVRGERTSRRITVRFGACFNGATHRSAWRGLPWRVGVLSRW